MTGPPLSGADLEFLRRFERAEVAGPEFGHRQHLRMAWLYIRQYGREGAEERAARGIRNLTLHHGAPGKYHDTLTRAWVRAVGAHADQGGPTGDFDAFVDRFPALTRGDLMLRHYSPGVLWSEEARVRWVEPDLAPFPA